MGIYKKIISLTIVLYSLICLFATMIPGLFENLIYDFIGIFYFTPLILPTLLLMFFFVTCKNKATYILCVISFIAIFISAILSLNNPLNFDLSGNLPEILLSLSNDSLRIASLLISLVDILLATAIYVFSNYKTKNKVSKIAKGGIAFTVAFTVLVLMQMTNLYGYNVILSIVPILTYFLWYIFLTLLFLFAFFDKESKLVVLF